MHYSGLNTDYYTSLPVRKVVSCNHRTGQFRITAQNLIIGVKTGSDW